MSLTLWMTDNGPQLEDNATAICQHIGEGIRARTHRAIIVQWLPPAERREVDMVRVILTGFAKLGDEGVGDWGCAVLALLDPNTNIRTPVLVLGFNRRLMDERIWRAAAEGLGNGAAADSDALVWGFEPGIVKFASDLIEGRGHRKVGDN